MNRKTTPLPRRRLFAATALALLFALPTGVKATTALKIDLTVGTNLSTVDRTYTYNLGPTGMRGWIDNGWPETAAQDGYTAFAPYQILVTTVGTGTPAAGILAVDDVILGASAGSGAVPLFTSDARKSLGLAIGAAEAANGVLSFKRWRAGVTTDVSITLPVMGAYSDTAPYNCSKTTLIRTHAAASLAQRINTYGWGKDGPGSINALALLATGDATYLPMLQTYARSIAPATLDLERSGIDAWSCYQSVFLAEYYMLTNDAEVFHGLSEYVIYAAKHTSMFGTAGHGFSNIPPPGGWAAGGTHGSISWYGPVNQAGLVAQLTIALGKKAGVVSPEIDPGIERAANFFGYYVNRGSIPYGEHQPYCGDYQLQGQMYYDHRSNGKDGLAAVMFACMDNKPVQTKYFSRMALAGYNGEAYGHTGQGFSYLWTMLGANMGGQLAAIEYHKNMRWDRDMKRRSDGAFVYEGGEQWAPGKASDYFDSSNVYYDNPTAYYLIHACIPLKKLYITGKNANPANDLDAAKVSNATWAAQFTAACGSYTKEQLFAALGEWDPIVRFNAATELATRALTSTEVTSLITMAENPTDANQREAACTTLGCLQATSAIPALTRRLKDTDIWVRAKAAKALTAMGAAAAPYVPDMLDAFVTNVKPTYPFETGFNWSDPLQIANGYLSETLFNYLGTTTINADKSLLYPAVRAGIKQPAGMWRGQLSNFVQNLLTLEDVKTLAPELFEEVTLEGPCDRMFTMAGPFMAMSALSKYHIAEGIDLCMDKTTFWGWDAAAAFDFLKPYDEAARRKLPDLYAQDLAWMSATDPVGGENAANLDACIARIEAATTASDLIYGLALANPQILVTPANTAKAVTLTGSSCRQTTVICALASQPLHGTLTGTPPDLTYTPAAGYQGMDRFTFTTTDGLTTSAPATVHLVVGTGGTGLNGSYYDNMDFTSLKTIRIDPTVNFDWGTAPPATLGAGTYSVRWTGQVMAPETGTYRFSTRTSDGVRLWINGVQVVNDWNDQVTSLWNDSAPITLTAGQKYSVKMEYYDNANPSTARLYWYMPSRKACSIIPQELLFPVTGVVLTSPSNESSFAPGATVALTADVTDVAGTVTNVSFYNGATLIGSGTTAPYAVNWTNVATGEYYLTAKATNSLGAVSTSTVVVITVGGNAVPVTSGLACWFDSSYGVTADSAQQVTFWHDRSGNGHDAVFELWDKPTVMQNQLFSKPAIRFSDKAAGFLDLARPLFVKEQYVVVRSPSYETWSSYGGFLCRRSGDRSSYLLGGSGFQWLPAAVSKNGTALASPFNLGTITSFMVLKITVDDGDTRAAAYQIGRAGGYSCEFDVTEILGYSRALTSQEQAKVGGYLTAKYGLVTAYPATGSLANRAATGITSSSAAINATLMCNGTNYNVTAYWGPEDGGINPNNWVNSAAIGSWTNVASVDINRTLTNLVPGTTYYYTFRASNATDTIWATPAQSFTTLSTAKDLLTFGANVAGSSAVIDAGAGTVAWTVPYGTGLTNLAAAYTASFLAAGSPASGASLNFSTPQAYIMTAQDGSTKTYTVTTTVAAPSTAKDLLTFGTNIAGSSAVIHTTSSSTGTVAWSVPYGTGLTSLAPVYTASFGEAGNPVSGASRNFTTPQTYTLTAQDLSTKVYTVTVTVLPNPAKDLLTFGTNVAGSSALITSTSSTVGTVLWKVPNGISVTNLAPTYTVSPQASGSPASGTSRDFTTPQTYTITAQDLTTKVYTVTVTWSIDLASTTGVFLANTVAGGDATLAAAGNLLGSNQYSSTTGNPWHDITDGATNTKWIQVGPGGWGGTYDDKGGFYFTLPAAAKLQGIQFFTEDSAPSRSPLTMTIEGSTATGTALMLGSSWTLVYSGDAGLANTPNNSAGVRVNFTNNSVYTSYRVLFPSMVDANVNSVQLADIAAFATLVGTSSPPEVPTGLTATPAASGAVALTWNAPAGATGYKISIKNTATNAEQFVTTTASPYTATGLTNGTSYQFKVLGTNSIGDGPYSSVVSATPVFPPSTTTLASSLGAAGSYGTAVTFTATVAVTGGPAAGTVTFRDGATLLGAGTLDGSGQAAFTPGALAVGAHSITASYPGNTSFGASTSSAFSYTVNALPLTITGVTANNKSYDGNAAADLTGGTLGGGVVGGETVTVTAGTGSFANANAGTWAVTASGYALGGAHAGNYVLSAQPAVPDATITARPVQLTGTRIYDGTTAAAAGILAVTNKVSGDDLGLTGSVTLAAKEVGSQGLALVSIAAPTYVQSKSGSLTGGGSATSFNVTALTAAPTAGNTLVAVISTCNTSQNPVAGIGATSGTALNWQRAAQSTVVSNGTTTEVWYAPVLAGAGSTVTINLAGTGYAAGAVVAEYRGVLTANPVDQVAGASGTSSTNPASTGTTPATTQANDLAFGGIGLVYNSNGTFSGISGGSQITSVTSGSATSRVRLYAIATTVTTPATASFTGTMNTPQNWSGVIATFKAPSVSGLSLTGTAAANYTFSGATGAVAVTPKTLTVSGLTATSKIYDGATTGTLTGVAALAAAETAGAGTTADGKPYSGDTLTLGGTAAGTFADPNAGTAKPVTVTGKTLTGAQAGNYTLTQPGGLTASITPAALTVTANHQDKTYGQTVTFGSGSTQFTSSGLQHGETIGSVTLACTGGDSMAAVAAYPITPGAATDGTFTTANYSISYAPGILAVNPAGQTITFGPLADKTYGDAPFTLTATTSSGLAVSCASSDPAVASVTGSTVTILKAGTTTLTASQPGDGNHNPATPVARALTVNPAPLASYATWAADPAQGLTAGGNDGPLDDPDHDGISNLLEFTLGGKPLESSRAILPKLTKSAGDWLFEYERSELSKSSTTQVVEYGSDLAGWTPLTVPATSAGNVAITPGTTSDHVKVIIPDPGSQVFVRLKVSQ